eukprot:Blabericola_migrator_1__6169@NODE_3111_length_2029_cov_5033_321101_g1948_i0_p2_GENE_NODE_3111_length_2029_cov_5033_321101_g1948_i0NODE_3111_length_2029_cov_5033_321101_g1948_i0_p2_ORF_typecomplete_len181_score27_97NUDIX/PF00293_28/5_5e21zfNADHPPase/PF09297_11/7_2e05FYVE/PF01363_21/0_011Zn_Tnp_IS1595/PF12760_7/0_022Ribosomal_S27/PF01599_19/0_035zfC2HC5/PF06221_13/0_089DUF1922/PF09082_10/0_098DUF35_N/PF12172_8/2_6DUF35_N/PF12172_8/49RRM_1/PF00076_22/0_18Zn_ribbon_recom/PF13408_6/2DUF1936/PF09151_1
MKHPLTQFAHCPKCGSGKFSTNDERSKKCGACGFIYYLNVSAATAAIVMNKKGELLVCRRAQDPAKGTLDLPGGFLEIGETAEDGIKREVLEETGLVVTRVLYLFSIPNIYLYSGFVVRNLDLFFLCHVEQTDVIGAHDDVAETFFMRREDIKLEKFGMISIREGVKRFIETQDISAGIQ